MPDSPNMHERVDSARVDSANPNAIDPHIPAFLEAGSTVHARPGVVDEEAVR